MENNDCEIESNAMNHQDANSANDDDLKKQLKDFLRLSNKSSQLSGGDYQMLPKKNFD